MTETVYYNLIETINPFVKQIFYIGQTDNPTRRLKEHYASKNTIQLIKLYKSNKSQIDILEQRLIQYFSKYEKNMNVMKSNKYKILQSSDKHKSDDPDGEQYLYLGLKTYNEQLNKQLLANSIFVVKLDNANINIVDYDTFKQCSKDKIISNSLSNQIKDKSSSSDNYDVIFQKCIDKINPILLQNINVKKYFIIERCEDYKKTRIELMKNGISEKCIKLIKRNTKDKDLINKLKYNLCKYYGNRNDIQLGNKNNLLNYMFKNVGENANIFIYFY